MPEERVQRLRAHIRCTPVLKVDGAEMSRHGVLLLFKLEYLQQSGAFKARSAFTLC